MGRWSTDSLAPFIKNRQFMLRVGLPILAGILVGLIAGFLMWFLGGGFKT